jgi:folate-dependent tRNA-U54 methylase TrmFO/GidA
MNANFGLLEPLPGKVKKADRKTAMAERAMEDMETWRTEL